MLWNYFSEVDAGGKCNECQVVIKCTTGSTSGMAHLLNKHPKVKKQFKEAIEKEKVSKSTAKKHSFSESSIDMFTPKIKDAFVVPDQLPAKAESPE